MTSTSKVNANEPKWIGFGGTDHFKDGDKND